MRDLMLGVFGVGLLSLIGYELWAWRSAKAPTISDYIQYLPKRSMTARIFVAALCLAGLLHFAFTDLLPVF